MKARQRKWTEAEVTILTECHQAGVLLANIAKELNRSESSVRKKWEAMEHPFRKVRCAYPDRAEAPETALAERDRRINAPYRDLTAAFFGDPPLGYSALDRRT